MSVDYGNLSNVNNVYQLEGLSIDDYLTSTNANKVIVIESSLCGNLSKIKSILLEWKNKGANVEYILYLVGVILNSDKLPFMLLSLNSSKELERLFNDELNFYYEIIVQITELLESEHYVEDIRHIINKKRQDYLTRFSEILNSNEYGEKLQNLVDSLIESFEAIITELGNKHMKPLICQDDIETILKLPILMKNCQKEFDKESKQWYEEFLYILNKIKLIKNYLRRVITSGDMNEIFSSSSYRGNSVEELYTALDIIETNIQKYCFFYTLEKWGYNGLSKSQKMKFKRNVAETIILETFRLEHLKIFLTKVSDTFNFFKNLNKENLNSDLVSIKNYEKPDSKKKEKNLKINIKNIAKYYSFFNITLVSGVHYLINGKVIERIPDIQFYFFLNLDIQEGVEIKEGKKVHMLYVIKSFAETIKDSHKKTWTEKILENLDLGKKFYDSRKYYLIENSKISEKQRTDIQKENVDFKNKIDNIFKITQNYNKLFGIKISTT